MACFPVSFPFRETRARVLVSGSDLAFAVQHRKTRGPPFRGWSQKIDAGITLITGTYMPGPMCGDLTGIIIHVFHMRKQIPRGFC